MEYILKDWHLAADAEGTMVTDNNGQQIARWPPQGGTIEQCANARLIAAAPDLLVALQNLLNGTIQSYDNRHEMQAAEDAINKATGK